MLGSYLMFKSMCSWIPKPKLPVSEKLLFFNSYSLTFKPRSRISSAYHCQKHPNSKKVSGKLPWVHEQWRVQQFFHFCGYQMFEPCIVPKPSTSILFSGDKNYLTVNRSLTAQLFQYFSSTSQSISTLSNGNVEDKFLDPDFPHGVSGLFIGGWFRIVVGLVLLERSCMYNFWRVIPWVMWWMDRWLFRKVAVRKLNFEWGKRKSVIPDGCNWNYTVATQEVFDLTFMEIITQLMFSPRQSKHKHYNAHETLQIGSQS